MELSRREHLPALQVFFLPESDRELRGREEEPHGPNHTLIFGIERGSRRRRLVRLFQQVMNGMSALPINLPFTLFNKGVRARSEVRDIVMELIREKRQEMEKRKTLDNNHHQYQDLITKFVSMKNEEDSTSSSPMLSDDEIVDNCIVAMVAGHDTSSVLLTFLEQEEIAKGKSGTHDEPLTWDDLSKMKYTWKVATEALRMYPPVFCAFKKVLQDFELGGYIIPKGWQIVWASFMTHMDESIYPDPTTFNPTRFDNKQGATPPFSYIAFGGGPRLCPGYELARIETLTMVHYMVTRFQWKLSLKENLFGRFPMPIFHHGLPIQVKIKKPLHES
ncbi:hypothetical protein MIMGU_mgv1a020504mg [Erythranthe guttata]|uniref:Cytochrome P450 n=1 Tax=Erythranthe guttata TaxID=4155 RepID=A0A022R1R9_ERYGU|nr:hypothetical protein MIMGU_mgv1a020504mg [Erythranthe guttata]